MNETQETPAVIADPTAIEAELQRRLMAREPKRIGFGFLHLPRLPRVHCADGFNVSIQTGETHYCMPREAVGPWSRVELGYPSGPMPELAEYADCTEEEAPTATETVWGYVPLRKVAELLASHGGIKEQTDA